MDLRSKGDSGLQDVSIGKPLGNTSRNLGKENHNKSFLEAQLLIDLKKEISDLTGRLSEARSSRDAALRKNAEMHKDHLTSLKQMQDAIGRLEGNNHVLQKERDVDNFSRVEEKLSSLEKEVDKVRCEKTDLRLRMDNVAKENLLKEEKIAELNQIITKLETSLQHLECQKADLLDHANEQMQRDKEFEMQKGALQILQQQLNKAQGAWEQSKDDLNEEKMKTRDLERLYASIEKELNPLKVDIQVLKADKKELEYKLANEMTTSKTYSEQIKNEQRKLKTEETVKKLGAEVKSLKTKLEEQITLNTQKDKLLEEGGSKKRKVTEDFRRVIKELEECKTLLTQYEQYKSSSVKLEELLKEKDINLMEKDKTITELQQSGRMLQEACVLLESQLKQFEGVLAQQKQDLDIAVQTKSKSEEELKDLKEELKKTKRALNDMKSLKQYNERRLNDVETSLKSGEAEKLKEIDNLKSKIVDMQKTNDFITEKMDALLERVDELKKSNEESKKLSGNMMSENKLLREESTRSLTEIMPLKESNSELKKALDEAITKCESYKERFEAVSEDLAMFEVGQIEKELRLQATLTQQSKLIEHLKEQNEFLCAKKRNFVEKFFIGEQKEPTTTTATTTKET